MYDVYNYEGLWIGRVAFEWQAEVMAYENSGYYVEEGGNY